MIKYLLFLSIASAATLCSAIVDHLKTVEVSPGQHTMRNIDCIYTINLDQRPEKFAACKEQLDPHGIHPVRFSAVNGWELSLETLNDIGLKYKNSMQPGIWGTSYLPNGNYTPEHEIIHTPGRNYFCHCMSRGAIGIVLSHLSLLKHALDNKFDRVWIMEDDIELIQNPHKISYMIDKLDALVGKDGWDILFTDQDTIDQRGNYIPCRSYASRPNFTPRNPERFRNRTAIDADFDQVGARYGAYSYIITASGIKKLYDFLIKKKIFLPYDMEYYLPNDMRLFAVKEDIVSTKINALSDNGAPGYQKTLESDSLQKANRPLKRTVFHAMNQLQGWCSEEKAAILVDLICQHKPETIVEIGVWGGKSLVPMAFAARANKIGTVYGIDPWSTAASAVGMDGVNYEWWTHVNHDAVYQDLVTKIDKFDLQKQIVLIKESSANAPRISNIGLLHIDGNHSEIESYYDVTTWAPLVKSGGFIVFDDINWNGTGKAVAWLDQNCVKVGEYHGDNIWGIWQKP